MKLNSYKCIADRYLLRGKKRAMLNILAISLAIGLFAAIATFVKSSEAEQIKQFKRSVGNFEVSFNDISSNDVDILLNNVELDNQAIVELKKELPIDNTMETIELCKYDEKTINDTYTFDIIEGRLPKKNGEIVISEKTRDFVEGMKLGNKVKINELEYEVVGVKSESQYSKSNPNVAFEYLNREDINEENRYSVLCNVKKEGGKVKLAQKIASDIGLNEDVVGSNTRLITMVDTEADGTGAKAIYYFLAIIYLIIMVATVAVIYNSFNISVTEKISQYGMLRAIGSSPGQIKYLVLKEGILSWLIALPIGLIGGIGALKLVMYIIINSMKSGASAFAMEINIYPIAILLASVVSLVSVIISALGPARTASKVSIIDTIRNPGNLTIKTQKIKKRKSIVSKLLFGFEGELAYKNVKRNNKRFIITVFSLILSLIMFNTLSSLIIGLQGGLESLFGSAPYDGQIEFKDSSKEINGEVLENIRNMDGMEYVYTYKTDYLRKLKLKVEKDKVDKNYVDKYKEISKKDDLIETDGKYEVDLHPFGVGDGGIEFLKANSNNKLKIDKLEDNEIILINPKEISPGQVSESSIMNYKVGEMIDIPIYKNNSDETKQFKIVSILEKDPTMPFTIGGAIGTIFTNEGYEEVFNTTSNQIVVTHKENFDSTKNRERLQKIAEDNGGEYADLTEQMKTNNEMFMQAGIFAYGFIAVITIIAILNIINTVSMSILTRKKEFGIIKAIGMHQGQLSKMISIEGILSGIYASVIGSIISLFIVKLIMNMYSTQVGLEVDMPYWIILSSGIMVIAITYVAALIPLRKLKNINVIESIKES